MKLYLVSLYWYGTDSYTSLYPPVYAPMHPRLTYFNLFSLSLSFAPVRSSVHRAPAHKNLILKILFVLSFALALVRPCGREFIIY